MGDNARAAVRGRSGRRDRPAVGPGGEPPSRSRRSTPARTAGSAGFGQCRWIPASAGALRSSSRPAGDRHQDRLRPAGRGVPDSRRATSSRRCGRLGCPAGRRPAGRRRPAGGRTGQTKAYRVRWPSRASSSAVLAAVSGSSSTTSTDSGRGGSLMGPFDGREFVGASGGIVAGVVPGAVVEGRRIRPGFSGRGRAAVARPLPFIRKESVVAKPKVKKSVGHRSWPSPRAGSNVWTWKTQEFEWRLDLGARGLNFGMVCGDAFRPVATSSTGSTRPSRTRGGSPSGSTGGAGRRKRPPDRHHEDADVRVDRGRGHPGLVTLPARQSPRRSSPRGGS